MIRQGGNAMCECVENKIKEAKIYPEILGSDHCPVGLEIEI